MIASIKISIQDLTASFIEELKAKYGAANLEINIIPERKDRLTEQQFWSIIDALNWDKEEDTEIVAPAIEALVDLSIAQIYDFEDKLTDKLHQLDQKKIAEQTGYQADEYFSLDRFLYARACVIANGKDAFEEVLTDVTSMPKDLTFEPLLSLAAQAYHKKTNKSFKYIPAVSYETYANQEGWK